MTKNKPVLGRYQVFAGEDYYPLGGWVDFKGSYRTKSSASRALGRLLKNGCEWGHIIDAWYGEYYRTEGGRGK
jgi:hypothetical protein